MSGHWACYRCGAKCPEPQTYCSDACRRADQADLRKQEKK